jgi:hypothetical protein
MFGDVDTVSDITADGGFEVELDADSSADPFDPQGPSQNLARQFADDLPPPPESADTPSSATELRAQPAEGSATKPDSQRSTDPASSADPNTQFESESRSRPLFQERPLRHVAATIVRPEGLFPAADVGEAAIDTARSAHWGDQPRTWIATELHWDAPAVRSLPRYFEDPNLERRGYYYSVTGQRHIARWCGRDGMTITDCPPEDAGGEHFPGVMVIQPVVSATRFFGQAALLPYQMGVYAPWEPIYDLGSDLPGSPAPYRKQYIPLSLSGLLHQAAAVTTLGYILP